MEDKMMDYLVANTITTSRCITKLEKMSRELIIQVRINRTQKLVNTVLFVGMAMCLCNIGDLIKVAKAQDIRIKALEAKSNGDAQKGE